MLAHPTDFADPVNEMEHALAEARRDAIPTRTENLAYRAEQIARDLRGTAELRRQVSAAVAHDLNAYADRLDELAEDLSAGEW